MGSLGDNMVEERTSEHEDMKVETSKTERQKEKRQKKKNGVFKLWDNDKRLIIY